jgi:hypothetical protein
VLINLMLGVAAIVWNYRTSQSAVTHQQIRWIALAAVVSGGGGLVLCVLPVVVLGQPLISANGVGLLVLPIPLSLGVAVLHYHLFDIDFIINRTLVYGTLTAVLALFYVGSVVLLQQLFRPSSGRATTWPSLPPFWRLRPCSPHCGAHPGVHRPALLPAQVRCGPGAGSL